jgi:stearoyl-CoA desaturase (delta-9 desaturase)
MIEPEVRIRTVRERTSVPSRLLGAVAVVAPPLGLVAAGWLLWNRGIRPIDLVLLVIFYVACGLGITVGFHRLFTHKSFETSAPLRALLAILGSMAMQGPITQWVTDHRKHHALSDRPGDPHSPHAGHDDSFAGHLFGLWHAHVGWLFSTKGLERGVAYGRDLYEDRLVRLIDRLYLLWVALTLGLPLLAGYLIGGTWPRAFEALLWAGFVRIFLFQHMTFSINSICHFYGARPFRTRDESRNVWLLAIPSFGESWHNGHHAFPASAIHGLDPGQVDISGLVIRGMEKLGLASDIRRPDPRQIERRRSRTTDLHAASDASETPARTERRVSCDQPVVSSGPNIARRSEE